MSYGPFLLSRELQAKDSHLRCSNAQQTDRGRKFDEYANIPFSDERARLDNFAIHLQQIGPQSKGYIIVYAGPRARVGTAQARAKRAKDYMIKERGIEETRIITIDGGYRDRLEVELYALPSSMSPPRPNPSQRN
jgi:hypothetical protein